ncbi:hypothetical protein J6590_069020 [Homalodisca vitripennis]|nr:hypothetical protein J6590_069020 [Homalodisca vitripennis]
MLTVSPSLSRTGHLPVSPRIQEYIACTKGHNYRLTLSYLLICVTHESLSFCHALDTCLSHQGYRNMTALHMKGHNYRNVDVIYLLICVTPRVSPSLSRTGHLPVSPRIQENDSLAIRNVITIWDTHNRITAPRPTRESADCWPSHGETIAAQYLTCKFRHVRTDTRPSWPHRGRTVTDSSVYDQSNDKYRNTEYKEKVWKKIADNLELGEDLINFSHILHTKETPFEGCKSPPLFLQDIKEFLLVAHTNSGPACRHTDAR